jgi:hypothetical protein
MTTEHLKALIAQQFPFPIAYYFRRAMEEKEAWEPSCHLLLSLLEFLGTVLACDYLSRDGRDPEVDRKLEKVFLSLPTDGDWQGLIVRILTFLEEKHEPPFLPCLARLRNRSAEKEIARLVKWRNDWVHRKIRFKIGQFRRDLMAVLSRVQALRQSALIYTRSSRMGHPIHFHEVDIIRGDNPNFAVVECRSEAALESEKMYLYSGESREVLCLDPFMTHSRCDDCPERHFFQYNKVDRRKVYYSSLPGRHDKRWPEALFQVERLVRSAKPVRLSPRYFSLPGEFAGVARTLRRGDRLGPYRIEEALRVVGLSQVYRATDTRTGDTCALKVLPMELSRDPLLLLRFDEEARTLKRLDHPRVVKLRDTGEDFGDRYIALDLAAGKKVGAEEYRDLGDPAKPLREETIIDLAQQICDGLSYIHSQGLVHRDLKPGNLLFSGDRVIISDFGIAHARGNEGLTLTGMPVGTPNYMAPEQILGEEMNHRADLYSLGCVLYELATGRPPFDAEMPLTTTHYHIQAAPADITTLNPRISRGLANIILKLLQKKPDLRYQTAQELYRDLARANEDPAGPQVFLQEKMPEAVRAEVQKKLHRQYRFRLVLTGTVFAALLAGLALFLLGKAVYWDLQVKSWVADARVAWEEGPERMDEALGLLERARRQDREHPAVQALMAEVASQGALTIRTQPEGLEMELFPDEESARQLNLESPRLVPGEGPRFRSGERVRLGIGPWRVKIARPAGEMPVQALVHVGQVRRHPADGWKEEYLTHRDTAGLRYPQEDSSGLVHGEEVVIDSLVLPDPEWVADGSMVYVNEGPFWRSPSIALLPPRELTFIDHYEMERKLRVYDLSSSALERDSLERGFLISPDEVTVAQFKKWLEELGPQYYSWIAEGTTASWMSFLKTCTRFVDLDHQKACWQDELGKRERAAVDSIDSPERLIEVVFEPELQWWTQVWRLNEDAPERSLKEFLGLSPPPKDFETLSDVLGTQNIDAFPMISVGRVMAEAYARTHAPIRPDELKSWLRWKIADASAVSRDLKGAVTAIHGITSPLVEPSSLPGARLVRVHWRGEGKPVKETILHGYTTWLSDAAFYGCQLPVERILTWAESDPQVKGSPLADRIPEIRSRFEHPVWIGESPRAGVKDEGQKRRSDPAQEIIDLYGRAIQEGRERPLRAHLLEWLEERIREEDEARCGWESLLERLGGPQAEAALATLPFGVRYEYGGDMGWDIPNTRQWEKACRGPDGRAYPWGDDQDDRAAWLIQGSRPRTVTAARMRDLSPYGVYGLAGNVSEWVRGPSEQGNWHFLKGGNYKLDSLYSNAGFFLGIGGGTNTYWAGFRVVREIRPLPGKD